MANRDSNKNKINFNDLHGRNQLSGGAFCMSIIYGKSRLYPLQPR